MADNNGYQNDDTGVTSFTMDSPDDDTKSASNEISENEKTSKNDYEEVEIEMKSMNSSSRKSSLSSLQEHDGPYAGMPKEVLLKYSRQAKFVWARNILTALVILTIFTLIALVISIVVISPPCLDYWQISPVYQIYPKSYKDTDADGYGDLKGIIEKLDYLNANLGVKVLWLNPVYASPQVDNGYDISDFRGIDETFGTMEDMDNLIIEMHNRGMKLVMDFVPNHSSDKHEWFVASSNTSHEYYDKYKDYYVWVDGMDENDIPNNWVSEFNNGSAWTWNADRGQFYFHAFFPEQPDLNIRNEQVQNELKDILRFWLEKGVDGFRCDAIAFMFEAEHLRDNPVPNSGETVTKDNIYPDYTQNYIGVHDIVAEWRDLMDEYSTEPGVYRFMEVEVYADIRTTMRYYGTDTTSEGDFPMNFLLITADPENDWNAVTMRSKILEWMSNMPDGKWANWVISNHDNSRLPSRVGDDLARCAALMIMTLPGTPGLYYGDEIGMSDNNDIPDLMDFRDPERTPMQWNVEENAGFCTNCTPWLPVNPNYMTGTNVQAQMDDNQSMLRMYKRLISLRTETVYQRGYLCVLEQNDNTLIYVREMPGLDSKMIMINFDDTESSFNLADIYDNLPGYGSIEFYTGTDDIENSINFRDIRLNPGTGVIVDYDDDHPFRDREDTRDNCFIHLKVCFNNALGIVQTC